MGPSTFGLRFQAFQVWPSGARSPFEMAYISPFTDSHGALMSPGNYGPIVERTRGIEPRLLEWKSSALPLS